MCAPEEGAGLQAGPGLPAPNSLQAHGQVVKPRWLPAALWFPSIPQAKSLHLLHAEFSAQVVVEEALVLPLHAQHPVADSEGAWVPWKGRWKAQR